MLNVLEFIREKKADFKDNTEQYRIKLEPKFRSLSNRINHKLKNTLNNPWLSNFKSIDSSYFLVKGVQSQAQLFKLFTQKLMIF